MKTTITIIGAGHGGQGLAGHLAILGYNVCLYAHHEHLGGLTAVHNQGGVHCTGQINGFGKIKTTTTNLKLALNDAQIIFISLPVPAHDSVFKMMMPFLTEGQTIINLSGHFSGLFQSQLLKKYRKNHNILIADITSFPYACRSATQGTSNIIAIKKVLGIASESTKSAQIIKSKIEKFFPCKLFIKSNFIEAGLYDPSGISHPPTALFNAGRIGNREEFYFYKQGISLETAVYLEVMDNERIEIGKRLGFNLKPYHDVMNEYYDLNYNKIYDFFKNSPMHNANKLCPDSLKARYISEDVPYSLVPWYSLGKITKYRPRAIKNIIDMCSIINQKDYFKQGRKLTKQHLVNYAT